MKISNVFGLRKGQTASIAKFRLSKKVKCKNLSMPSKLFRAWKLKSRYDQISTYNVLQYAKEQLILAGEP